MTSRDKSDKHKLTKPESVVNSRSKSPSRSEQTECVEVLEKTHTNSKASMEHEKCELIEEQSASDWEVSPEGEGDISEHSTDDKPVERISFAKVIVHCVSYSTKF